MCKLSDDIKFCTCSSDLIKVENFWTVSRKENKMAFGDVATLIHRLKLNSKFIEKLENKLNTENLFDFEYFPIENDKLELNLSQNNKTAQLTFIYTNEKWQKQSEPSIIEQIEESFSDERYFVKMEGEIRNAFKIKQLKK